MLATNDVLSTIRGDSTRRCDVPINGKKTFVRCTVPVARRSVSVHSRLGAGDSGRWTVGIVKAWRRANDASRAASAAAVRSDRQITQPRRHCADVGTDILSEIMTEVRRTSK